MKDNKKKNNKCCLDKEFCDSYRERVFGLLSDFQKSLMEEHKEVKTQVVQEKRMCKYCGGKNVHILSSDNTKDMSLENDCYVGMNIVSDIHMKYNNLILDCHGKYVSGGDDDEFVKCDSVTVELNYCPFCGRKLDDDDTLSYNANKRIAEIEKKLKGYRNVMNSFFNIGKIWLYKNDNGDITDYDIFIPDEYPSLDFVDKYDLEYACEFKFDKCIPYDGTDINDMPIGDIVWSGGRKVYRSYHDYIFTNDELRLLVNDGRLKTEMQQDYCCRICKVDQDDLADMISKRKSFEKEIHKLEKKLEDYRKVLNKSNE